VTEAEVVFLGNSIGCLGVPTKVFGVLAILGQQEPGMPLVDGFIVVFKSIGKEFNSDVSFFLGGVFHPITTILRGYFDKVCSPCDMAEEIRFLSAVYDAVEGNLVAKVNWDCCQGLD